MHFLFPLLLLIPPSLLYLLKFIHNTFWLPWKIHSHFNKQGVNGPSYTPIYGNTEEINRHFRLAASAPLPDLSHDVLRRVLPHYHAWSTRYGKTLRFWFGTKPRLIFIDPDMTKEVLVSNSGCFGKDAFNPLSRLLFGQGLVGLSGDKWAAHRKIANQAFTMERVKAWVPDIIASTAQELDKWDVSDEFEMDVHKPLHNLSADIIARTAFGSSFEEGRRIFELQDKQTVLTLQASRSVYIPGMRFLPTKNNRLMWKLEREIRDSVRALIHGNCKVRENSRNLLTLLMNVDDDEKGLTVEEVIDECKTFYFAGKETTANVLSWVLLLLAMHPDWQIRVRDEALRIFKANEEHAVDNLNDFKLITMVLYETMRLYPPVCILIRHASRETKLGSIDVPAMTQVNLPILAVHHDTEIWGPDAHEFNPLRFSEPRKHLASYFPFGLGPKICVGQNLAMVEAKIVLAMVIRRFVLSVSPSYIHAPILSWTLEPQHGAHIIFRRIDQSSFTM